MQVLNYTEFRRSMKAKLDQVSDNDTVIVSRSDNKNVVVISLR